MYDYKITMIVPVYNVENYLEKCLDSLVAQTIDKKDMEVLLINDGSTDIFLSFLQKKMKAYLLQGIME